MKALFGSLSVLCRLFFKAYALIQTHLFGIHEFLSVWLTAKHGVEQNMDPVEEHVKKTIVTAARETWEIYFSRLFPASVGEACPQKIGIFGLILVTALLVCLCVFVQGSVGTGVQVLSVSHSGIKLLKTVKSSAAAPDYFRVLRPYTYVWPLFLALLWLQSSLNLRVTVKHYMFTFPLLWGKLHAISLRFTN